MLRISFNRLLVAMDLSALLAEEAHGLFLVCEERRQTALSGSTASGVITVQVYKDLMRKEINGHDSH